ncbi:MAG: sulfite exporter TauE/SafE family protein [Peptococcaceae bacterium]|nr:sulfite exporter TauE/SafE family protein [Peptococcaceae bacterium]
MAFEWLFIPIGIIVGTLSGFYGIGGGIVLVPILFLSGFSPAIAIPTSLMFTFGTSLSGAIAHTKMNNVDWKIAPIIGLVGALTAQGSNRIVMLISGRYDWLLSVFFIILQVYFLLSLKRNKSKEEKTNVYKNPYLVSTFIGIIIGFLSSLLGIGGGFITIPLLMDWLGFNTKRAIGTSLAAIIIISIGGIIGYSAKIQLNYLLGVCLIIGAFIGSPFGARMTAKYKAGDITKKLVRLYAFVIASTVVDLLSLITWSFLKWVSLTILLLFLAQMLFDFYKHRHIGIVQNIE